MRREITWRDPLSVEGSPERGGTHRAWRDPPSVEGTPRGAAGPKGCPRHARWIPTREVDPNTRGGSRHARWILTRKGDPDKGEVIFRHVRW